jgi:hypothetical protein
MGYDSFVIIRLRASRGGGFQRQTVMTACQSCQLAAAKQREDGSSDHFDKIRQFLAGIEIYPFAGRIRIGQALIFFALNPDQALVS